METPNKSISVFHDRDFKVSPSSEAAGGASAKPADHAGSTQM